MAKSQVALTGVKAVRNAFKEMPGAVDRPEVQQALLNVAVMMKVDADASIATLFKRKTGRLARSTRARKHTKRKGDPGAMFAINTKVAPHAHLLEYGTVKMAARPFFRPALDAHRRKLGPAVGKGLKKALEAVRREVLFRTF